MVFGHIMQLKLLCTIRLEPYPGQKLPTYFSDEAFFLTIVLRDFMKTFLFAFLCTALWMSEALAREGQGSSRCETTYEGGVSCGGRSDRCETTSAGVVACGGLAWVREVSGGFRSFLLQPFFQFISNLPKSGGLHF